MLFLGWFNFTLTCHPGSKNTKPNALSRQFTQDHSEPVIAVILSRSWEPQPWQVEEKVRKALSSTLDPGGASPNTLFVPESVWSEVLQWGHKSRLTCHPGLHCNLHLLQQCFWWPSMVRDTRAFIAAHFVPLAKLPSGRQGISWSSMSSVFMAFQGILYLIEVHNSPHWFGVQLLGWGWASFWVITLSLMVRWRGQTRPWRMCCDVWRLDTQLPGVPIFRGLSMLTTRWFHLLWGFCLLWRRLVTNRPCLRRWWPFRSYRSVWRQVTHRCSRSITTAAHQHRCFLRSANWLTGIRSLPEVIVTVTQNASSYFKCKESDFCLLCSKVVTTPLWVVRFKLEWKQRRGVCVEPSTLLSFSFGLLLSSSGEFSVVFLLTFVRLIKDHSTFITLPKVFFWVWLLFTWLLTITAQMRDKHQLPTIRQSQSFGSSIFFTVCFLCSF